MLPFKTILFATDFSPASKVAFEVAAALARDYKARVIAMHVIEPVKMGFSEFGSNGIHDAPTTLTSLYLRLVKAGATYTGYFSPDGQTWTPIAQAANLPFSAPKIGLSAWNTNSVAEATADFDQFCMKT